MASEGLNQSASQITRDENGLPDLIKGDIFKGKMYLPCN